MKRSAISKHDYYCVIIETLRGNKNYLQFSNNAVSEYYRWLPNPMETDWYTYSGCGKKYRYRSKEFQKVFDYYQKQHPQLSSKQLLKTIRKAGVSFVREHTVPVDVLLKMLYQNLDNLTENLFWQIMDKYNITTIVLKTEDTRLTQAGVSKSMPLDWDGKDPFARYKLVGIEIANLDYI